MVASIGKWSKKQFDFNIYKKIALLQLIAGVVWLVCSYPHVTSNFSTAKPFINQMIMMYGGGIIFTLFLNKITFN